MLSKSCLHKIILFVTIHDGIDIPVFVNMYPKLFLPIGLKQDKFFESQLFALDLSNSIKDSDYVGHITYSYQSKMQPFDFVKIVNDSSTSVDIYGFLHINHDTYAFAEEFHPGFLRIWSYLLKALGYGDFRDYGTPLAFYCNYWIMKKSCFERYQAIAKKAMLILSEDSNIRDFVNMDSNYKGTLKALSPETLMGICGKPYYTFHPFIMERLICFIAHAEKWNIKLFTHSDTDVPLNTFTDNTPNTAYQRSIMTKRLL